MLGNTSAAECKRRFCQYVDSICIMSAMQVSIHLCRGGSLQTGSSFFALVSPVAVAFAVAVAVAVAAVPD